MRVSQVYDLAVLWLLSHVGRRVVETIYQHGYDDGVQALREDMRAELVKVQVASATDRMRSYNMGFADAMRYFDDEPQDEPIERVM